MPTAHIVCPTHGRAGTIRALKVFGPDLILCVSESQHPLYVEHYPDVEYAVHSDEIVGLSAKRQWIYEKFGNVFQVDDDVHQCVDMTVKAGEYGRIRDHQQIKDLIQRCQDMAEDLGVFAYSFSQFSDPVLYRPMQPFRLTGLITGHSLGLREGSKLWFPNDRYVVAEDMWVSLLNAHHHRICLIDRRYAFVPYKTFVSKGAQAEHRTNATLKDNFFRFRDAFGDVVQKKPSTPRARAAYEYAITMRLPW